MLHFPQLTEVMSCQHFGNLFNIWRVFQSSPPWTLTGDLFMCSVPRAASTSSIFSSLNTSEASSDCFLNYWEREWSSETTGPTGTISMYRKMRFLKNILACSIQMILKDWWIFTDQTFWCLIIPLHLEIFPLYSRIYRLRIWSV